VGTLPPYHLARTSTGAAVCTSVHENAHHGEALPQLRAVWGAGKRIRQVFASPVDEPVYSAAPVPAT